MHAPALLLPNGLHHLLDPALNLLLLRSCMRTTCELRWTRPRPLIRAAPMRSQRAVPGSAGRHVHFLTSFSSFLLSFSPARAASNQQQPQSVKHSWTSAHGRILASDMTGHHSRFAIAESVIATPSPPSEGCRATALSSSVQGPPDCGAPAAVTPTVDCGLKDCGPCVY